MRCLERQRKTKQHNTTQPKQLFFKEKLVTSGGTRTNDHPLSSRWCSYQLSYRGVLHCVHVRIYLRYTISGSCVCMCVCMQELVIEKDSRIRESMLMMGLRHWVLWTSWFIKQLLFMLIWVISFPILMKVHIILYRDMRLHTCKWTCIPIIPVSIYRMTYMYF